jgi:hypothetical protein
VNVVNDYQAPAFRTRHQINVIVEEWVTGRHYLYCIGTPVP